MSRRRASDRRVDLRTVARVLAGLTAVVAVVTAAQLLAARRDAARGQEELLSAERALSGARPEAARRHLARAEAAFGAARATSTGVVLRPLGAVPLLGSPVRALVAAAGAGQEAVGAGRALARVVATLAGEGVRLRQGDLGPLHRGLDNAAGALDRARVGLVAARHTLRGPSRAALPFVSEPAQRATERLSGAIVTLDRTRAVTSLLLELAGPEADLRLLLLAQDTLELRATGGFIGSFGVIKVSGGRVELERYDSYEALPDPQPPMEAPAAMRPWLPRPWGLSNVNWWPDFPTSAGAAKEAFERQGGGRIDGVLAITDAFLGDVLSVIGPLRLPGYPDPVTAEGLAERIVYEVELKRPPDVPRKRFLIELADVVFDRLLDLPSHQVSAMSSAFERAVAAGDLQAWFADRRHQRALDGTVAAGRLPVTDGDFLAVVDTNRSAGKANKDLTRDVTYRVDPSSDGRYTATLELRYRNEGRPTVVNPWYFGHVRVYVPAGATLQDGTSAGVTSDGRARDGPYQVLTTEVFVEPGKASTVRLVYLLPPTVESGGRYRLTWVRQAGTPRDRLVALSGDRQWELDPDRRRLDVETDLHRRGLAQFVRSRWLVRTLFD